MNSTVKTHLMDKLLKTVHAAVATWDSLIYEALRSYAAPRWSECSVSSLDKCLAWELSYLTVINYGKNYWCQLL